MKNIANIEKQIDDVIKTLKSEYGHAIRIFAKPGNQIQSGRVQYDPFAGAQADGTDTGGEWVFSNQSGHTFIATDEFVRESVKAAIYHFGGADKLYDHFYG